ncbi:MAG: phosphohistidine phosphatase SixA [Acidobacteria bacterium]|nr:phosphohistidine phosphatase SixA [Acidobacteriota bacterium]
MLYLVHHGDAVGPDVDPMRPLSDRGRLEVEALARQAAERGARPDVVWHSGKLRAKQTAEAFWRHCNALAPLSATHGLQPADPTAWILDAIAGDTRSIMLVGHFPHLPRLLSVLLSGSSESAPAPFPLHGAVALEEQDGKWSEKWRLGDPPWPSHA